MFLKLLDRMLARIRRRDLERESDDELAFHIEMQTDANLRQGMTPDEARRAARLALGGVEQTRELVRDQRSTIVDSVWHDVRYAMRTLRHSPGYTTTAVLTLVLGIGLNTGLFTLFNATALRPWPVASPRSVVRVRPGVDVRGRYSTTTWAEYLALRSRSTTLTGLAAFRRAGATLDDGSNWQTCYVSSDFFTVLGVRLQVGRSFLSQEEGTVGDRRDVAIISDRLWRDRLGSDPRIVGRPIRIGGRRLTVVGITEPRFFGPDPMSSSDLYLPIPALSDAEPGGGFGVELAGRMAPGATRPQVKAELDAVSRHFRASAGLDPRPLHVVGTTTLDQPTRTRGLDALGLMLGAAVLLLVVACSNVGNLQLARAQVRQREIGIRLAIGASRARIVRQLLTESVILSFGAGAAALAAARFATLPILVAIVGDPIRELRLFSPDLTVVGFTLAMSLLATGVTGLAPALRATRPMAVVARGAVWSPGSDGGTLRLRTLLLATQIALATVLLIGAGLLTRGTLGAISMDLDVETKDLVLLQLSPAVREGPPEEGSAPMRAVVEALSASGVAPIGLTETTPLVPNAIKMRVRLPSESDAVYRMPMSRPVSNGFFSLLRIPIVAGRLFDERRPDAREAIVNETFAKMFWPGKSAVGETLVAQQEGVILTVVGVSRDCHETGLEEIPPVIHTAASLGVWPTVIVRSPTGKEAARLRAIVAGVNPKIRVTVAPLRGALRDSLKYSMLGAAIAWALGLLALALASIGVFGVFAYIVEERRREIGIRMALGARAPQVIRLMLAQTRAATGAGLMAGFALSLAAGRILRGYLYGVGPADPIAYAGIAVLLLAAAVMATYVPALRATRVDPAVTLRCE